MSINLMCSKCRKTHKISTRKCKCGNELKRHPKYRVRVRTETGWKSKICGSYQEAQKVKNALLAGLPIVLEGEECDTLPQKNPTAAQLPKKNLNSKQKEKNIQQHTGPTLDDYYDLFIEWATIHKKSWKNDRNRYIKFIQKSLGHLPAETIKPFQIQRDVLNPLHKRGYAPASVKHVLVLIKRIYNWAAEQGFNENEYNPCKTLKVPKFDNRVTNPISNKEDLKRLEKVLDGWYYNKMVPLVIRFALYTGRRKGEILALKWRDIDLKNNMVTIKKTKSGMIQTFPLNSKALEIIVKAQYFRPSRCPYVFPNKHGNSYHYSGGFDKTWRLIRKKAGLSHIRFHDLRHTFASWLASSGKVDIYTLKELLGHSDIKMTQRYAHLINGALRKAVNVADEVF